MPPVKLALPRKRLSGQKSRNLHAEDDLQTDICNYHRLGVDKEYTLFAVPNGGKRSEAEGARLKRMGVTPGVSDLILVGPNRFIVFIEVKLEQNIFGQKKTTQSADQVAFEAKMIRMGFPYVVVRSKKEYYDLLQKMGVKTHTSPL